eukprot:4813591-Prymnesium_polylepis.1
MLQGRGASCSCGTSWVHIGGAWRRGTSRQRGRGTRRGGGWLRRRSERPGVEAEGWGASGVEGLAWQEAQRLTAFGRSTANE